MPSHGAPPGRVATCEWAIHERRMAGLMLGEEALPLPPAPAAALREMSVERVFEGRPGRTSNVPEGVIN